MNASHRCSMPGLLGAANGFTKRVVTDLDGAVFEENVVRFQITVHNASVMQVTQPLDQLASKEHRLVFTDTGVTRFGQHFL